MTHTKIGKYARGATRRATAAADRWRGWFEPKDREWVIFVASDGSSVTFLSRDATTGAVLFDAEGH